MIQKLGKDRSHWAPGGGVNRSVGVYIHMYIYIYIHVYVCVFTYTYKPIFSNN
jgi:hypothetical protein